MAGEERSFPTHADMAEAEDIGFTEADKLAAKLQMLEGQYAIRGEILEAAIEQRQRAEMLLERAENAVFEVRAQKEQAENRAAVLEAALAEMRKELDGAVFWLNDIIKTAGASPERASDAPPESREQVEEL